MKKKRLVARSALAIFGLVAIGIVSAAPAQARVFIGFGFGPFWGFPFPYPYVFPPFPFAYPFPSPPPYYSPSAAWAPPVDPGYGTASSTWYYCDNPRGYYPYVRQCHTGWRAVAASSVQH